MPKSLILGIAAAAMVLLLWHLGSRAPSHHNALAALMEGASREPGLEGAAVGLCILDVNGRTVFTHQADTAFIPASSLKTLTTATALELLGPDFRFETRLLATAAPM